jgi:pyruvate/2-oxoglutarate dehydrogenase complex dihydrolipoamide dehydrogenase (E3) component
VEVVVDQMWCNDVILFYGEVAFKDLHTVTVTTGKEVHSSTVANILIVVGTVPVLADSMRFDGEVALSSDDVPKLKRLPRHMAVVGAASSASSTPPCLRL